MGLDVELEHGRRNLITDITHDEPLVIRKVALVRLNEISDYFAQLAVMADKRNERKVIHRENDYEKYTRGEYCVNGRINQAILE